MMEGWEETVVIDVYLGQLTSPDTVGSWSCIDLNETLDFNIFVFALRLVVHCLSVDLEV